MLLILTPIQTSFIAINNLLKDYAQGGWAPWPGISFFRKLHPDAGAKYTLAEEKTFCTYGGRPRDSSPNSPKPYEAHSYCSLTLTHSKPVNWSGPVFRQSLFQSPRHFQVCRAVRREIQSYFSLVFVVTRLPVSPTTGPDVLTRIRLFLHCC